MQFKPFETRFQPKSKISDGFDRVWFRFGKFLNQTWGSGSGLTKNGQNQTKLNFGSTTWDGREAQPFLSSSIW